MIKPYTNWYKYNKIDIHTDDVSKKLIHYTKKDLLWHLIKSNNQVIISRNGIECLDTYLIENNIEIVLSTFHSRIYNDKVIYTIYIDNDTQILFQINKYSKYSSDIIKIIKRWINKL